jgi:hypothetical protein
MLDVVRLSLGFFFIGRARVTGSLAILWNHETEIINATFEEEFCQYARRLPSGN